MSIWLDTNGTSALITPRAGLCGAEQNQSFSIPSDIDPNTYDQLGISRHLLFSSPPDTNHLIAHVDATTSMFNYTLTNSSYSTHNQLFSPNYNHTISPSLFYVASQYCMAFTSGPLYDSCAFLLPPATPLLFQRACLEDVAASDSLIRAEPSIIAYSQLCQLSNASLGNLVFLLPLFFVLLIPFTFYYFILLTLPKLVSPIVALHSTAYGSAAGFKTSNCWSPYLDSHTTCRRAQQSSILFLPPSLSFRHQHRGSYGTSPIYPPRAFFLQPILRPKGSW